MSNIFQYEPKQNVYDVKDVGTSKKKLGKHITVEQDKFVDELLEIIIKEQDEIK